MPSSWAHASNARVGITFSYPADTFRLTETPEGLLLASTLTRAELGGDPHPANWTYSMLFSPRAGDRRAAISRELPTFLDILFPDGGQLDVNSGMSSQATVAGKDAYRVSTGIEGYDDDDLFVDLGAKGTLLIRCRTVGDVMGAKPPEAAQSATCAAVVGSIGWR